MGKLLIVLDDAIEKELRETVKAKYGNKKGALSIAVEEAIIMWLAKTKLEALKNR